MLECHLAIMTITMYDKKLAVNIASKDFLYVFLKVDLYPKKSSNTFCLWDVMYAGVVAHFKCPVPSQEFWNLCSETQVELGLCLQEDYTTLDLMMQECLWPYG